MDDILREEACFSLKDLAVNGNDLLAMGLRGREVGLALQECLGAVMDDRVPNERDALLVLVQGMV
jgi:tRNA nucleotidyltransferase (CCA-adding enzyme)